MSEFQIEEIKSSQNFNLYQFDTFLICSFVYMFITKYWTLQEFESKEKELRRVNGSVRHVNPFYTGVDFVPILTSTIDIQSMLMIKKTKIFATYICIYVISNSKHLFFQILNLAGEFFCCCQLWKELNMFISCDIKNI